jgi:hypothetical protein
MTKSSKQQAHKNDDKGKKTVPSFIKNPFDFGQMR